MNKKEIIISILKKAGVFLILVISIAASLDELRYSEFIENYIFISIGITFLIMFAWEKIIKRILDKWF
jgi:hypothetical protein